MINPVYLNKETIEQMKNYYNQNGFLLLDDFLDKKAYEKISKTKFNWKEVSEPDRFSYSISNEEVKELGESEVLDFISKIIGKTNKLKHENKKFGWKNYTLMNDLNENKEKKGFIYMISDEWQKNYGGQLVYLKGDQDYMFYPKGNSILLFNKTKKINEFVKYVNNRAEKKHFILIEYSN